MSPILHSFVSFIRRTWLPAMMAVLVGLGDASGQRDDDPVDPTPIDPDRANQEPLGDPDVADELRQLQDELDAAVGPDLRTVEAAFQIFPEAVREDIERYITRVVSLLVDGKEAELKTYLEDNGSKIATIFDQLGLKDVSADSLLNGGQANPAEDGKGTELFPNEYRDFATYDAYLESLGDQLTTEEKDYLRESNRVATEFRSRMHDAGDNDERIREALEAYQSELESINEKYSEHFRERFLESLDRADSGGGRPDIDR